MKPIKINEFDIWALITRINENRKRIIRNTILAGLFGLAIAFCIPKEYVSSAMLVPEAAEDDGLSGNAGALASMVGIRLGGGMDAIGPDLYPKVVASNEFVVDLLPVQVETIDGRVKTDFLTYLKKHTRYPWWAYGKILLGRIMKVINPQPIFTTHDPADGRINPHRMSREDENMIEQLKANINCNMDEVNGIINITFRSQDPLVSKMMVDTVTAHLQDFITAYRTGKARNDLEYYQKLAEDTRIEFERTQHNYAQYCDSHKGNLLQAYQSEMESLENEMQIAMNAYTQVKQQVQMAEAKVQEKTPAFTIVEGAGVPNRHASPRKMLMTLGWMFLGFVGTLGWIYARLLFSVSESE